MDRDEKTTHLRRLTWYIEELLIRYDPQQLYSEQDDNRDEYAPEAADIVTVLSRCRSLEDLRYAVWRVFIKSFGKRRAGGDLQYHEIAEDIWLHMKKGRDRS